MLCTPSQGPWACPRVCCGQQRKPEVSHQGSRHVHPAFGWVNARPCIPVQLGPGVRRTPKENLFRDVGLGILGASHPYRGTGLLGNVMPGGCPLGMPLHLPPGRDHWRAIRPR